MDTQTTPFRHRTTTWYLAWPGTLWPQDFIRGRLASLFEAKGNRVKTLSFFPVWILGQWSTSQDHTTARTSRSSTLMSPSIGLGGASDFILGTPGLTLVVVTSLPDDDLLGSLALDPRTPGSAPRARGLRSPLSLSRIAKTIKISIVRTMGP